MKRLGTTLMAAVLVGMGMTAQAQSGKQWTLAECIQYAMEQNIQLKQDMLSLLDAEEDLALSKANLFPSLSFSTSHGVGYRPYQETVSTVSGTQVVTHSGNTSYNGSYQLGANWTVWNGGRNTKNIRMQKTARDIAQMTVAQRENTLKEQITKLYVQILYAHEALSINKSTLEVSTATYNRAKELFNQGTISKVELAQLESQMGTDNYNVVAAESALRGYKRQLKQLLEISETEELDVVIPELSDSRVLEDIPSQLSVYQEALQSRPEIQSSLLSIENAKTSIAYAKAGYLPTLSLNGSISTNTYNKGGAWTTQMKNNWYNGVGVSLSIPIFDNRQNKTAVRKAQNAFANSQLSLATAEKQLYSDIETIWLDAVNAQQQFRAAQTTLQSSETSFDLVTQQFDLGMKNTVELLTEKNNLINAQLQKVQSKYMALLNKTLLQFYTTKQIEL